MLPIYVILKPAANKIHAPGNEELTGQVRENRVLVTLGHPVCQKDQAPFTHITSRKIGININGCVIFILLRIEVIN